MFRVFDEVYTSSRSICRCPQPSIFISVPVGICFEASLASPCVVGTEEGGRDFRFKEKIIKREGGLEKRKMRRIVHSFLRYHRGLKKGEDVQMTQIFFCPCCSFVSFMIESALHFIRRTYIFQVMTLTTFEMSPNHAKSCQDGPNFQ